VITWCRTSSNESGERSLRDYAMPQSRSATPGESLRAARRHRGPNRFIAPGLGAIVSPLRHPLITGRISHARSPEQRSTVVLPTVSWHATNTPPWRGLSSTREILDEQLDVWRQVWTTSPVAFHGVITTSRTCGSNEGHSAGGPVLWFGVRRCTTRRSTTAKYGSGSIRWVVVGQELRALMTRWPPRAEPRRDRDGRWHRGVS